MKKKDYKWVVYYMWPGYTRWYLYTSWPTRADARALVIKMKPYVPTYKFKIVKEEGDKE